MYILLLSYIMNTYCMKLRYYNEYTFYNTLISHNMYSLYNLKVIYIYIYILSFKAQLITNVYLNRKTLNLIIKKYPKQ